MIKKLTLSISLFICLTIFASANASEICLKISASNSGQLTKANCNTVWQDIASTGIFPGVFSSPVREPMLYPLCYVSVAKFTATLTSKYGREKEVLVSSKSAWTTDLEPFILSPLAAPGSPYSPLSFEFNDNTASIVSEWTIYDPNRNDRVIGKIYSMDILDLIRSKEVTVIINGTGNYYRARGSVVIESQATDMEFNTVELTKISGTLCFQN